MPDCCQCVYCQLRRSFIEQIRKTMESERDIAELAEIEELEQLYKKEIPFL